MKKFDFKLLGISILVNFSSIFLINLISDFELISYLFGAISMLLYSEYYDNHKGSDSGE